MPIDFSLISSLANLLLMYYSWTGVVPEIRNSVMNFQVHLHGAYQSAYKHSPRSGPVWCLKALFLKWEKLTIDQVIAPWLLHFDLLLLEAVENEADYLSVPSTQVDEDFVPDDLLFLVLYHPFPQWPIFDNSSSGPLLLTESRCSEKTAEVNRPFSNHRLNFPRGG